MPGMRLAVHSIVALVAVLVVTTPASGQQQQPTALVVHWRASEPMHPMPLAATAVRFSATRPASLPAPGSAADGPRLPLIGALIGGAFLGALALGECDSIGCSSPLPVALAVGVGAGAGALTGWVIQRLRTRASHPDTSGTSWTTTLPNCCPL